MGMAERVMTGAAANRDHRRNSRDRRDPVVRDPDVIDPDAFDENGLDRDPDDNVDVEEVSARTGRNRSRRRAPRTPVHGMRRLAWTVGAIVVVVGLIAVAYLSPLMSVRSVAVTGARTVSADEIRSAAAISQGTPLLQVDTMAAARRISVIPRIKQARVSRSYPSSLDISVTERVPVVSYGSGADRKMVDDSGFLFPPVAGDAKVPVLATGHPGPSDAATRAAVTVIAGLPAEIRDHVLTVTADSPVNVVLRLDGNRTVDWGDADRTAQKATTLHYLLGQDGSEYNVSSPDNPAVR